MGQGGGGGGTWLVCRLYTYLTCLLFCLFLCLFVLPLLLSCCLFLPLVSPIGPPFTHLRQPERSVTEFCPDLSVSVSTTQFLWTIIK